MMAWPRQKAVKLLYQEVSLVGMEAEMHARNFFLEEYGRTVNPTECA